MTLNLKNSSYEKKKNKIALTRTIMIQTMFPIRLDSGCGKLCWVSSHRILNGPRTHTEILSSTCGTEIDLVIRIFPYNNVVWLKFLKFILLFYYYLIYLIDLNKHTHFEWIFLGFSSNLIADFCKKKFIPKYLLD